MTEMTLSNVVGLAATTTAVLCYSAFGEPIPHEHYRYNFEESAVQYLGQYDYYTLNTDDSISIADKIKIIHKFSTVLLENIKDIEPEFSALVDEKFWDLL